MIFSFNIGYVIPNHNAGILNDFPILFEGTFGEFKEFVRGNVVNLLQWADHHYVPKSSIVLFIHIEDEVNMWEFKVNMINVRDYKQLLA